MLIQRLICFYQVLSSTFAPMSKCWGYILSVYILLCAVVPCAIFDECNGEQQTAQTPTQDGDRHCNDCVPFSACASCHGFTPATAGTTIEPFAFSVSLHYCDYYFASGTGYSSRLFQPPRQS